MGVPQQTSPDQEINQQVQAWMCMISSCLHHGSCTPREGVGGLSYKRDGVFIGYFEGTFLKAPRSCFVGMAWLQVIFSLRRNQNKILHENYVH